MMIRKALIMILTCCLMSACVQKESVGQDVLSGQDKMLLYMEEKYGEKFEYIETLGKGFHYGTDLVLVSCESLPDRQFFVEILERPTGGTEYYDNYMAMKLQPEIELFLETCARRVFGQAVVCYDASNQLPLKDVPADASAEEYLRLAEDNTQDMIICVPGSELINVDIVRKMGQEINPYIKNYRLKIIAVDKTDVVKLSESELSVRLEEEEYITYGTLLHGEEADKVEWKEGRHIAEVCLPKDDFYEILEMEPNGGLQAGTRLRGMYTYSHAGGGRFKRRYFDVVNRTFYDDDLIAHELSEEYADKICNITDYCHIETWDADISDMDEPHVTTGSYTWKIVFIGEDGSLYVYHGYSGNFENYPADFEEFLTIVSEAGTVSDH